jgi:hypothetical protein
MAQNPKDVEEETLKKIVFLLSRLKAECKLATGYDEKQFFEPNEKLEGRKKSDWQQYYLRDFRKNLFYGGNDDYLKNVITYFYKSSKLNFAVGKAKKYGYHGFLLGNETTKNYPLVSMGAMRSSSALIANILSRPPFDSKPMKITLSEKRQVFFPGDYEVYFEYPLRTLIQDGKPTHPSMADAVLISRDSDGFVTSLIIIESKLMEYFFGKPPLAADTYLDETNYFPNLKRQNKQNGQSTASEFVSIFKEINQNIANGSIKFDAGQLIHHALGYLNERLNDDGLFHGDEFSKLKAVTLVNSVWNPLSKTPTQDTEKVSSEIRKIWEAEKSDEQRQKITLELCDLMSRAETNGPRFSFVFLPALDFADLFEQPDDLRRYLQRYRI